MDHVTCYIWVFLTISKSPTTNLAQRVINKFKSVNYHRTVRTDQGGEIGRSSIFQKMVDLQKFTLKLTGSDASAQNGVAESPNKYLGNMMRCLLRSAGLGPEYWFYTLIYAV